MSVLEFDYIIVGAGSAGCAMAYRLTEDGNHSVLLLEYGGSDKSIFIQMPTALSIPMNKEAFNWFYESDPEPHLNGRRMHCPRGKVIGGSSSINGMVYVRGNAMDFETWEEMGAKGWSYKDVLPYFRRAENRADGGDSYRGDNGPLHTSNGPLHNPLYHAFVEAGKQAGYPLTDDYNGFQQEGFGRMDMTVHNGVRWSTANAYLKPAMGRKNLQVETRALATKILLDGKKATGIAFEQNGQTREAKARKEVILASGPINNPQLLQLSGIGNADYLRKIGIETVHHLPGVGENLQDHLEFYFQVGCKEPITLNNKLGLISKGLIGTEWILTKGGLGATNHFESCGFIRSRAGIPYPDIQYHFLPAAMRYDGNAAADGHGFQAHVGNNRSKSRGFVRVRSQDPREKPQILFNYMSHEDDWIEMRACVRLTREIFAQPAFDQYRGDEISPGMHVQSDDEIDEFIKGAVESAYHASCTCKIGTDEMAVVDPDLRVHGIDNLRIADSSVFPQITNGNLNAPSIMVGEKAADHILGKGMLSASNAPFYKEDNWETIQRPGSPMRTAS